MKQYAFEYDDPAAFEKKLAVFKRDNPQLQPERMLFYIYTEVLEKAETEKVCGCIEKIFPDVMYLGCSTSGNIVDCCLAGAVSVVCAVFEDISTRFTVKSFELTAQTIDSTAKAVSAEAADNSWVKAIEMYFCIPQCSFTRFCSGMDSVSRNVKIFGGVTCSNDISSDNCCVFTKEDGYSEKSMIAVFYGGENFHADAIKTTGWKQLKRTFRVTRSEGSVVYELDGIPAYDVYRKYLGIPNDENFFMNTLEFPLFYEHNGTTILRVPVASSPDGSITVSSDIEEGSVVRISYGDPRTVVEKIGEDSLRIRQFCPDVIHIFSCAARRAFWNENEPTYELAPFKTISPSAGFFSHGEFIRTDEGLLNQHNVTLVIAAMREGDKHSDNTAVGNEEKEVTFNKIPLVSRLATFIAESSRELEEFNSRLELINGKLKEAVIIDGLTGLYNRKEIQTRIENQLAAGVMDFSLIMLDIDNFKQVNDTYGHQKGDMVIIALAEILRNEHIQYSGNFSAGRWGGEEFMLLLPETKLSAASLIAELIRKCFADIAFPDIRPQTISVGVTQAQQGDTIDSLCTRVDSALYSAKKSGKNKVVSV